MISALENIDQTCPANLAGQDDTVANSFRALSRMDANSLCPANSLYLAFAIDEVSAPFFAKRVPHVEQSRVRKLLAVFQEIHLAGRGRQNPEIKRLAMALQMPFNSLRRLYYGYARGCTKEIAGSIMHFSPGDWRSALNWSKVRPERENLPAAFLEFWRTLLENNQRKAKPAWDELMQIIRTGYDFKGRQFKKIPGFDQFPQVDPILGHPVGMSYENLCRKKSSEYDLAATRQGRAAATEHRIPVLKTRVGLRIGQFMEFDDHEFDQKILFQKKPMRPLAFGAVDTLTDCLFKLGMKPTLWDEDYEVKRKLTEREALWFILAVLCGTGYRRDKIGTTLVIERGIMTLRDPYLSRLLNVVGDYVKVYLGSNAGNHTRAAHAGQFGGQPKGNPRTKRLIESKWNPLNNQLASLLGQVGKDRDASPAQLYGAEKYTGQMIRAADEKHLPVEALQLPFHAWNQWAPLAHDAAMRINLARDHQCEGWEKCGFVRKFWRSDASSTIWHTEQDFSLLSEIDRAVLTAKMNGPAGTDLSKVERASRWEVFQALRRELTLLPMYHVPEIVGPEFALRASGGGEQLLTVRNGLLSFDCAEIDSDSIHFYARDIAAEASHFIPNGRKFVCFVNPYLPTHLIACDEQLRVQAICPRYERASDQASLDSAMGAQAAMEAAQRVRLNLRHDDESRMKRAMKEHNASILGGPIPKLTPAEKEFVQTVGASAANDFLTAAADEIPSVTPGPDFLSEISQPD